MHVYIYIPMPMQINKEVCMYIYTHGGSAGDNRVTHVVKHDCLLPNQQQASYGDGSA